MKNPLDTDRVFSLELMNPNPTSSKTKDGPKYRVSFEMHKDDWQTFMDADTNGMVLEMQGRVQERHGNVPDVPDKPKGGPLSIEAAQWCHQAGPNSFAVCLGYAGLKDLIYDQCSIISRAELDHNARAANRWQNIKDAYNEQSAQVRPTN